MAMRDEIKVQTDKMKDMDKKEKKEYIWTYYKWWIIGAICAVVFVVNLTSSIIANSKPIYLNAVFINSDLAVQPTEISLETDFNSAQNIELKDYREGFDYNTFLTDNIDQTSYANQIKLISRYTAEELDVVAGPEAIMTGPADPGAYAVFDEVVPAELLKELEEKGYEIFYYTEKEYDDYPDENGVTHYTEGATYPAGIYIDKCDKLISEYGIYSPDTANGEFGRVILTISPTAPNPEHAVEFIRYIIN